MRPQFKILVIIGAMLTAGLGAAVPASAAAAAPVMDTSIFACNNGVCEVGPGNVGTPFAAGLNVGSSNNPPVERYYGDCFTMKITTGSLPPGLQLSLPSSEWIVTGTPTRAGTYPFTVQFTQTEVSSFCGPGDGPPGTQQLSITIGTGTADRLDLTGAIWSPHSVNKTLQIQGFDANFGATYTVFVTANGTKLGTFTESSAWQDGGIQNNLRVPPGPTTFTSFTSPGSITVTDSLGGSATIPVTVNPKYS
jgi:Putative Ig domain